MTKPAENGTAAELVETLRESGLDPKTWEAVGVHVESSPQRIRELLGMGPDKAAELGECLVFPYFSLAGEPLDYHRLKPATPRKNKKTGKPIKYEAPAGERNRLYFPPLLRERHESGEPIIITEGEKKALCACQHGFPTIGVSGVWNWKVKKAGLLPEFGDVAWAGRTVYIAFDSDRVVNEEVRRAEAELAAELKPLGAEVRIVALPPGPRGEKTGLDDFFARGGTADQFRKLLERAALPPSNDRTANAVTAKILAGAELWHDGDVSFATVNGASFPVRSKVFDRWFTKQFFEAMGCSKAPPADAVGSAANLADALAMDGPQLDAFVRVGEVAGELFLHLADTANTVIAIGPSGWAVRPRPEARLIGRQATRALPMPERVGSIEGLRRFINLEDESHFSLVRAWVASCFWPSGPFPVLVIAGEQGTAKSTATRVLKWVVDPNDADVRKEPRETRDLMVATRSSWVMAFDNLSSLTAEFSDDLCRLATGAAVTVRENYSNDEETIFRVKRPIVLNGIGDLATRADLLERSILIRLGHIDPAGRLPEAEFERELRAAMPRILGGILDYVAGGLRELPKVKLAELPRMADFALRAVACERGAGRSGEEFLLAYRANQSSAHEQAIEGNAVADLLLKVVRESTGRQWHGTATELLGALTSALPKDHHGEPVKPHLWPKSSNALSNLLSRLAPSLREAEGLDVCRDTEGRGGKKRRAIAISFISLTKEKGSSPSSPSSPPRENKGKSGDGLTCPRSSPSSPPDLFLDPDEPLYSRGDDGDDPHPEDRPRENAEKNRPGDDGDDGDDLLRQAPGESPGPFGDRRGLPD